MAQVVPRCKALRMQLAFGVEAQCNGGINTDAEVVVHDVQWDFVSLSLVNERKNCKRMAGLKKERERSDENRKIQGERVAEKI